jgi:hypothetical protein
VLARILPVTLPPRLRVPQEDGAVLAVPPLGEVPALLARNRRLLERIDSDLMGRPVQELRRLAQAGAYSAARDYVGAAGEPLPDFEQAPFLLAGHQPELFHPGVWVKSFALHGLARRHHLVPLNLLVDSDTVKTNVLHVPARAGGRWHTESIPFDHGVEETPYEERQVHEEAVFASLPERAAPALAGWPFTPLLGAFWAEARRQAERTGLLGERFAAARRTFERRWGCHNLELPVSRLCQTEAFAWFACHLVTHLPRFHTLYNVTVQDYRRRHGIDSRNHPVPNLAREGSWLESPFWAWRAGQRRRGRLMVRQTETAQELRAGAEPWPALPPTGTSPEALVKAWQGLQRDGFKIRGRALMTTLYARLLLGELFIHGIGGARYDELTDELIRRFYGMEPPGYLVLSATLRLPLPGYPVRRDDWRRLQRRLRDLHYNPQRHLDEEASTHAKLRWLIEEKQAWIARQPVDRAGRRERFRVLQDLTGRLWGWTAQREEQARQELAECEERLRENAVMQRRDYALCLYPEAALRGLCGRLLDLT